MEFLDARSMLHHVIGDLTISELAKRTGIGRSRLSYYMSGYTSPTPKSLRKIEKALRCKITVRYSCEPDPVDGISIWRALGKKL